MCDLNIEQAGVHYASHAVIEAQRALQRELDREADAHVLIKNTKPQETAWKQQQLAVAVRGNASTAADASAEGALVLAAGQEHSDADDLDFSYVSSRKATDRLDRLGGHPPGDYTVRQQQAPPPVPLAVLRDTVDSVPEYAMLVTAESGRNDVRQLLMKSDDTDNAASAFAREEPEMDDDERAAMAFVSRNIRYRNEFMAVLKQLREHRRQRESLSSLEDLARNALADVWSLQWEDLYELFLVHRRRAADDMRARLSKIHWHERLETRRRELEQSLESREREAIFHEEPILAELDMKRYLEWWNEQLASFELGVLLITGPEGKRQFAIEDRPAAASS